MNTQDVHKGKWPTLKDVLNISFKWYDLRIGLFFDTENDYIYIYLIPMFPLRVSAHHLGIDLDYPWLWGIDLKSKYKSIWLGWWLVTFTTDMGFDDFSIDFQPGL